MDGKWRMDELHQLNFFLPGCYLTFTFVGRQGEPGGEDQGGR